MRTVIEFKERPEGRLFLKTVKKNKLFKDHLDRWEGRSIYFKFENEEQSDIVMQIVHNVLNKLNINYE